MIKIICLFLFSQLFVSCEYTVTINNGTGSGTYDSDETQSIPISAYAPEEGMRFYKWEGYQDYLQHGAFVDNNIIFPFAQMGHFPDLEFTALYVEENKRVNLEIKRGSGSGIYEPGDTIKIVADSSFEVDNKHFFRWTGNLKLLENYYSFPTDKKLNIRIGLDDVTLIAEFKEGYNVNFFENLSDKELSSIHFTGKEYSTRVFGYKKDKLFARWEGDTYLLEDPTVPSTEYIMPNHEISFKAIYEDSYNIVIEKYNSNYVNKKRSLPDREICIRAPKPSRKLLKFSKWEGDINYLSDIKNPIQCFIMPPTNLSFKAKYKFKLLGH